MNHMWLRVMIRTLGQSLIVIGCAISAGVAAAVLIRESNGPEVEYLAHAIGGVVCLSIILGAILLVLIVKVGWEDPGDIEEATGQWDTQI